MIAISSTQVLDQPALIKRLRDTMPQILGSRPVRMAYLFGSAATDSTTPLSDIDIALVGEHSLSVSEQLDMELEVQLELAQLAGIRRAEVRLIDHLPLLLRGQVVCQGILLFARDETLRIEFETKTRAAYFDFKPLANAERDSFFADIRIGRRNMVNREKVEGLVRQQQEYLKHLRALAQVDEQQFASNPEKTGAAKYYLLVAIETCIDIGNHIISAEHFRAPLDYADVFTVLGEEKIFPPEFTRSLEKMAGFRNRLVHVYAQVDDRLVHEFMQARLDDFDLFQQHILRFVA